MPTVSVVMSSCPDTTVAKNIASKLVSARLVACVNIVAGVTSIYRWKGRVQEDPEVLVVAKTRTDLVERVTEMIVDNHPYELPEVIALPVTGGSGEYLRWVASETS